MPSCDLHPAPAALDWGLLDHDGLLTPVLMSHFGPITAHRVQTDVLSATALRRVSQLHQAATGTVILDAEMVLNTGDMPQSLLTDLQETVIPFGQLLIQSGLTARSVDREITVQNGPNGAERRLGRRHRLVDAQTGRHLCTLVETLSPLSVLLTAQQAYRGQGPWRPSCAKAP